MSSQESPISSKKRKSPFDSPTPGLTNKRRRCVLALNKEYLEQHSHYSIDSAVKFEDEDTRSLTSVSVSSVPSEKKMTKHTERDYASIASKFNIKLMLAKKYYNFLSNQPKVAIIKILPIKKEWTNTSELEETKTSSIFKVKKKGKKKKSQREKERSSFSRSTIKLNSGFNESVTDNFLKNETVANTEQFRKKKLNKRVEKNIENYLQTLNDNNNIEKVISFGYSPKKKINVSRSFENAAYDSESECEISKYKKNEVFDENEAKKSDIVFNCLSKVEQARAHSLYSEKKKSFWLKKFGSVEPKLKRQRFLRTFIKKDNDSDAEIANGNEKVDDTMELNKQVENNSSEVKIEEVAIKKVSRRRLRIINQIDDDTNSDDDMDDIQTFNSLSVNCQQLLSMPSTSVDSEDCEKQCDSQMSPLISFGEGGQDEDQEVYLDTEQDLDLDIQDDIIDLCVASPERIQQIKEETIATSNNLANGIDENSNSNLTDDLFDSSMKVDSPSDRLVIDLTPKSCAESPVKNTESSLSNHSSHGTKGKPKIMSDTKLEGNIMYNITPGQKKLQKPSPSKFLSSSAAESSGVQTPSKADNTSPHHLNGVNRHNQITSGTPTTRGLKAGLEQVKCNLNSEKSIKEYQNAKSKLNIGNDIDESLDSICEDLNNLTNTEGITLYKGGVDIDSSSDIVVILDDCSEKCARKKEDSTSSTIFNNNVSETPSSTKATLQNPSPIIRQSPQFRLNKRTPTNVSSFISSDSSDPTSQNTLPSINPLHGFPRIPRKDPRSNNSASPGTLAGRDPRLNRSLSPNKALGVAPTPATSMRLTRSATNNLQKSPGVSPADPRLTRGQSRPKSAITTPPTNISPNIEKGKEIKIVDPRLRKRKEREEAEKEAKFSQELSTSNNEVSVLKSEQPQVSQFGQSSPRSERKQRGNVFERLGCKEPSPVRGPAKNEFINFIKPTKTASPTKSICYETDDDHISLHPGFSDFYESSDEDDNNSSPRHRKFESERSRIMNTNRITTDKSASLASLTKQRALQQRLPVKERIGRVGEGIGNRRTPISAPSSSSTLAPPIQPTTVNTLINRQTRFGRNTRAVPQQPRIPQVKKPMTIVNVPPPNVNVPPPVVKSTNKQYENNSPFMIHQESFYQMNARQMMQDQDMMMNSEELQGSDVYVTFGDGTADVPSIFDHISILDNKPDTTVVGLSDPKYTFFNKQCYKMLREGRCKNELTNCSFQHQVTLLQKKIKTCEPAFVKAILETSIDNNFDYYLDKVWKDSLPMIKENAFTIYEKLYQAGKRNHDFLLQLLHYCLSTNVHTVDTFLRKISPIIDDDDSDTVQVICVAIKNKLVDGFCWETIKSICKKAAPPNDFMELILIQCLKRKKNRNHILEVNDLIKKKLIASERNRISKNLLKQFYELVERQNVTITDNEALSTMPLMNVTNNLTNGQSFERQSVNAPKPIVQPTAVSKITKHVIGKDEAFTPTSPDNTPYTSPREIQARVPVKGDSENFAEFTVKPISAEEPKSAYRDRFWKLYTAVECVIKGLKHMDYDYVWEQLEKFTQENISDELCKRAYYQILCKNVKASEHHLNEIIKRAGKDHCLTEYLK